MPVSRPLIDRFNEKVSPEPNTGCWLWVASCDSRGYGQIGTGVGKGIARAHRVSWELHRGSIPPGLAVCHRCDNPACCNPDHLFLGTQRDNMQDALQKQRLRPPPADGERNGNARLTAAQIAEIRCRYATGGVTQPTLASEYGVSRYNVSAIVRHLTWAHVGDGP